MTTNRLNILYIVLLSFVCLMFVPQASAQTLGDQFEEKFDKAWEATHPKVSESQINKTKEVLGDTVGGVVAGVASYGSGVTYDQPKSETERSKKMVDKYNLDTENGKIEITGKTGVSDYIGRSLKESGKAIADDWEQGNYLSAAAQASMAGAKAAWEGLKGLFKSGREIGTYTDPSTGKIYEFEIKKDGTMVATSGITEGCTPFPMKMAESKSCLFCPLFLVIYNACNTMATKSFAILGVPVANVMLIGFALYIAFIVLAHVSAFTKQDAPKFLTGLIGQSFKVLIAYLLLTNAD